MPPWRLAKPGDVLVIDGKGDQTAALMGTIMMTACKQLGLAGVVIDGAVRDSLEIDEMDFPVFCVGTNPNGPTKNVGGRIGHPVSCGGVTVQSGDFVIGDADGVVVVEREKIAALLPLAAHKVAARGRAHCANQARQHQCTLAQCSAGGRRRAEGRAKRCELAAAPASSPPCRAVTGPTWRAQARGPAR